MEETLNHPRGMMLGAPEVLSLNAAFLKALKAKKVIDVGVFTGASSLAAALALPEDGKVIACDINEDFTRFVLKIITTLFDMYLKYLFIYTSLAKSFWKQAGIEQKVDLTIAPATQTLQKLLDDGQEGTFDFAFIDADKAGYDDYYELCLKLLRSGGIIAFDNTLWSSKVLKPAEACDDTTLVLKRLNDKLAKDHDRSFVVQLNVGDGYTIAVKL